MREASVQSSVGSRDCKRHPRRLGRLPKLLGLLVVLLGFALPAGTQIDAQSSAGVPIYLDPKQPIERRVDDLMSRMTLKEKVGQLNLPCVYVNELGKTIPEKMIACKRFAAGTYTNEIGPGCGFFTLADTILHQGRQRTGGILQRSPEDCADPDSPENPAARRRRRDSWRDVFRGNGFSGRACDWQHV